MKNYYAALNLKITATQPDIKKSYRNLASKYHPDRNRTDCAEDKFKEISEAYEILSNSAKKQDYDNSLRRHYINLRDQVRTYEPYHYTESPRKSSKDKTYISNITLAQAYTGTIISSQFGNVTIPKGVRSGTKIVVHDHNVIIEIYTVNDSKFRRTKDDLYVSYTLNSFEAMLGAEAVITHLDDKKYKFHIPEGTQHGHIVKLTGKGMMNPDTKKYGDLYIQFDITVPNNLTKSEKEVIINLNKVRTLSI